MRQRRLGHLTVALATVACSAPITDVTAAGTRSSPVQGSSTSSSGFGHHRHYSRYSVDTSLASFNLSFNVMDFIPASQWAAGDVTDGVQAAFEAAAKTLADQGCGGGGACAMWGASVVFPHNEYPISRTLQLTNANHVQGQGAATIRQMNASADIFYSNYLWRWSVSGINFQGGRNHLHLGNPNIDSGFWTVDSCVFSNASSAAIRTMEDYAGCVGTDIAHPADCWQAASTTMFVSRSKFFDNEQVAVWYGDELTIEDAWVEGAGGADQSAQKALFVNYNVLRLVRVEGVPACTPGLNQRWVDHWGYSFDALDCRFGGECGGMTVVYNWASALCVPCNTSDPHTGACIGNCCNKCLRSPPRSGAIPNDTHTSGYGGNPAIRIERCAIFALNGGDGAVVYLAEIPAHVSLRDNLGLQELGLADHTGYALVKLNPEISLSSDGQLRALAQQPQAFYFELSPSNQYVDPRTNFSELPVELQPYQVDDVWAEAPPERGYWRAAQRVWAKGAALEGNHAVAGWVCVEAGWPGRWRAIKLD